MELEQAKARLFQSQRTLKAKRQHAIDALKWFDRFVERDGDYTESLSRTEKTDDELRFKCLGIGVFFRYRHDLEHAFLQYGTWCDGIEPNARPVYNVQGEWEIEELGQIGPSNVFNIGHLFYPTVAEIVGKAAADGKLRVP